MTDAATKESSESKPAVAAFSGYQKFVIGILAFLQFTLIVDFMIISPLGAMVMPALHIGPQQFALAVSAYAFSAGLSGLLAAGFADRFDRKKLLLFFYAGFLFGTVLCGIAPTYPVLLAARIVTGLFGGVVGSVVMAIITDLFPLAMRGRVMGFVQTSFAAAQILGIPLGLYLATWWDWHAPFAVIVGVGAIVGVVIAVRLQPVNMHLGLKQEHSPLAHLMHTVTEPRYLLAFAAVTLLATGGFMLMPFGSAFIVNNLKIPIEQLPMIYLVTGLCTIFVGPLVGRAADRFGKFRTFMFGSCVTITMVLIYTHMGPTTLPVITIVNVLMFVGVFSRIIPSQALMSAIPEVTKRGAFNAVTSSIQQVSGGVASVIAGMIVVFNDNGELARINVLGYVVVGASLVTLFLMSRINRVVAQKTAAGAA